MKILTVQDACVLLKNFLFVFIVTSSKYASAENSKASDNTGISSSCDYLPREQGQHNAFYVDHKFECCMCPAGYRFTGIICNSSDPTSTQCELCRAGTHINYGPHLQEKCDEKKRIDCPPRMVYIIGTNTEKDRCDCKPGWMKIGHSLCLPASTSIPSTVAKRKTTSVVTTTTMSKRTKNVTGKGDLNKSSTAKFTLVERIISPTTSSPYSVHTEPGLTITQPKTPGVETQTPSSSTNDSTVVKNVAEDNKGMIIIVAVAVVCVFIILSLLVLFVCWKYNIGVFRHRRKSSASPDDTPAASLSPLLPPGLQPNSNRDAQFEPAEHEQEQPTALVLAVPICNLPPENRVEQMHLIQSNGQQQNEDDIPQQAENDGQEMCYAEVKRNRKFMRAIGKKFDSEIPKNDAKRIFRHILGDANDETELQNIYDRYENNIKEMIFQFMLLSMQLKGKFLTPEYLLEKLESDDPRSQRLIDIVQDEMELPYMRNQVADA